MNDFSDKELLALFHDETSRHSAFTYIVKKYQQKIYWHIRRIVIIHDDADDVVQNTFIKAWQGLHNFREESNLYTWLYKIGTNESITFLNKKKAQLNVSLNDVEHILAKSLEDDVYYDGDEIQTKLQKAILSLPEKQRIVFNLKFYDEMKYEDMSEVLETSVGALKASYHHAVKKIEEYVRKN